MTLPKLWHETIEAHRQEVRAAIVDAASALVTDRGLLSVTMSDIAERAGIGRATLYKYFPDVEAVLLAWHDRQVDAHLELLAGVGAGSGDAGERLEAVLEALAHIRFESHRHDADLVAFLHHHANIANPEKRVHDLLRDLVSEGARSGDLRDDVPASELATYCVHALAAAAGAPSRPAVRRLVDVTLAGLRRRR